MTNLAQNQKVLFFERNPCIFPLEFKSNVFISSVDITTNNVYIYMGTGIDPNITLQEEDIVNIFAISNVIDGELRIDSRLFKNWNGMLNAVANPLQNCTEDAAKMATKIIKERGVKTFLIV